MDGLDLIDLLDWTKQENRKKEIKKEEKREETFQREGSEMYWTIGRE